MSINDHLPSISRSDDEKHRRIWIFPSIVDPEVPVRRPEEASVFVSIGAGETHVTILNDDGAFTKGWTAVFGWSVLCDLPFELNGTMITLEEEDLVAKALTGSAKIYGKIVNTTAFLNAARDLFHHVIDHLLSRTIGSGATYDTIVIAAPPTAR